MCLADHPLHAFVGGERPRDQLLIALRYGGVQELAKLESGVRVSTGVDGEAGFVRPGGRKAIVDAVLMCSGE